MTSARASITTFGTCALACAVAALSAPAVAQSMKPGLWEITQKMQSGTGQMEQSMAQMRQEMANMPPEQRKMIQDMMAKQGVAMGAGDGSAVSVKVCMTREMAERNDVPTQARGDCKTESSPRSGNAMKLKFTCTKPPSSGEGQVSFVSDGAYTMKMTVNTDIQGKPETITMDG